MLHPHTRFSTSLRDSALVTQSTGHTSVLHAFSAEVARQTAPLPTVGLSTVRARYERPPAHVTVHEVQLDQEPRTQSNGCTVGESDGTAVGKSVGIAVGVAVLHIIQEFGLNRHFLCHICNESAGIQNVRKRLKLVSEHKSHHSASNGRNKPNRFVTLDGTS